MLTIKLLCLFVVVVGSLASNVTREERVLNGRSARAGQFPYHASLRRRTVHICGGAILHSRWVLSTGTCLEKNPTQIAVGTIRSDGNGPFIRIQRKVLHYLYWPSRRMNDIGLIETATPIGFTSTVKPIELEPHILPNTDGIQLTFSGFGNYRVSQIDSSELKTNP